MTFDQMALFLESMKGQIRAFDTKAQVLLGVNGLLFGFITAEGAKAAEYGAAGLRVRFIFVCIALALAFGTSCISTFYALFVINPQLHLNQPPSKLFFCHLAADYGRDYKRAATDLASLGEQEGCLDLGGQIQVNALICDVKSTRCLRGMRWAGLALLAYCISVPFFCSMAYTAAQLSKQPSVVVQLVQPKQVQSETGQGFPHSEPSTHKHP